MINRLKKIFALKKKGDLDAFWFATSRDDSDKKKIVEEVAEKSSEDQRNLVRDYRKSRAGSAV